MQWPAHSAGAVDYGPILAPTRRSRSAFCRAPRRGNRSRPLPRWLGLRDSSAKTQRGFFRDSARIGHYGEGKAFGWKIFPARSVTDINIFGSMQAAVFIAGERIVALGEGKSSRVVNARAMRGPRNSQRHASKA